MPPGIEDLPEHDGGPFQAGEEKDIANWVEQFLENPTEPAREELERSDYRPSDAPPALVRRFLLHKPLEGDEPSWIPWNDLPDDLYERVLFADECKQLLYQASIQRTAKKTPLTVTDVFTVCARKRRASQPVIFDLSDIYICLEADVLAAYDNRDHPDPRRIISNPELFSTDEAIAITRDAYQSAADWIRTVLDRVGQAITLDASEINGP